MGCDFKPGDAVVYIGVVRDPGDIYAALRVTSGRLTEGSIYTVAGLIENPFAPDDIGVLLEEARSPHPSGAFTVLGFRKVERRNDRLSIEAFLTIKPGFEEPRRSPAKKRERA